MKNIFIRMLVILGFFIVVVQTACAQDDPLPSWNSGLPKQSIIDFVQRVTSEDNPDFVPAEQRIAVFDNDGTLWTEQPAPVQGLFAFDRVRAMASQHPEWKNTQPFKAVLENDMQAFAGTGLKGVMELTMATHAGMTTEEFESIVKKLAYFRSTP